MVRRNIYLLNEVRIVRIPILGHKGATLAEMWNIGLRVPFGFIISTDTCEKIISSGGHIPTWLLSNIRRSVKAVEDQTKKKFGDTKSPLLLAVRISTSSPVPGLAGTIFNIGINRQIALSKEHAEVNRRFFMEEYIRFIWQFGVSVMGIPPSTFNKVMKNYSTENSSIQFASKKMRDLIFDLLSAVRSQTGRDFPEDPYKQLEQAISHAAVSWNKNLIESYCRFNNIANNIGMAIIVQPMIFGNKNENSGCGVAFTRNPINGEKELCGYYTANAQGIDVLSGLKTQNDIAHLSESMPNVYEELRSYCNTIEKCFRSTQEFSFIIEEGTLYIVGTSKAQCTGIATLRSTIEMVEKGILQEIEGILMVDSSTIKDMSYPRIALTDEYIAKGVSVTSGIVSGRIIFDSNEAGECFNNDPIILVREHLTPEDINAITKSIGVLICKGGVTSHAAIVAKSMGKCCVCGVHDSTIDEKHQWINIGHIKLQKGDWITIDGRSGKIFLGKAEVHTFQPNPQIDTLILWANKVKKIGVKANCDNAQSVRFARENGAEGIGLYRTEHILFTSNYIDLARQMLLSQTFDERKEKLEKIESILEADLYKTFIEMDGMPVTIRTFDFPLHEFLQCSESDIIRLSKKLGLEKIHLQQRIDNLVGINPMLGIRGCRLGILYPEVTESQSYAIFRAAVRAKQKGIKVELSIMIPFVMDVEEVRTQVSIFRKIAQEIIIEKGIHFDYKVGVMIEQPRAALLADQISKEVNFLSFGTNDLTQLTFGLCRDDSTQLLQCYLDYGLLREDPFRVLDEKGVGKLLHIAILLARSANPKINIGICGEQAGNPKTIKFCVKEGLDFISCSPFDILVARLSAAQSAIINSHRKIYANNGIMDFNKNRVWTYWYMQRITEAIAKRNHSDAQEMAFQWAKRMCDQYSLNNPIVWKFFKRDLVDRWFGKRECKIFSPNWTIQEVQEYAASFPNKTFRLSLFPKDIACHALSYQLPNNSKMSWESIIYRIDKSVPMEMFPEPPADNICFRAFSTLGEYYVEAGLGQAMFVFEQEQGKHTIVSARREGDVYSFSSKSTQDSCKHEFDDIKQKLMLFTNLHGSTIQTQCERLRDALGIEYISIEGYYDIHVPHSVLVCDLDLPQDIAFISRSIIGQRS